VHPPGLHERDDRRAAAFGVLAEDLAAGADDHAADPLTGFCGAIDSDGRHRLADDDAGLTDGLREHQGVSRRKSDIVEPVRR
jgi:hypothetical protein